MIHYQLRCAAGHEFDGWFKDSATFEKQAARGLLSCPFCGSVKVERAVMAPAVARSRPEPRAPLPVSGAEAGKAPPAPLPPAAARAVSGPVLPDAVRAMLQRLRAEIEKHCDYVGADFPEEARRIHRGESPPHAIYGEASAEEVEALREEGIKVSRIPWLPPSDG
jgi:hypothetical protein